MVIAGNLQQIDWPGLRWIHSTCFGHTTSAMAKIYDTTSLMRLRAQHLASHITVRLQSSLRINNRCLYNQWTEFTNKFLKNFES